MKMKRYGDTVVYIKNRDITIVESVRHDQRRKTERETEGTVDMNRK